jgi:hypothetical protein
VVDELRPALQDDVTVDTPHGVARRRHLLKGRLSPKLWGLADLLDKFSLHLKTMPN